MCYILSAFCNINNFNLSEIPVNYFKNSKCIDNVCGQDCCNNYHGLLDYTNHYISRGIDDKGRLYILFFYKDFNKNRIFYEFIYQIQMYRSFQLDNSKPKIKTLITYSGYNNNCYIGNLSWKSNLSNTLYNYFKRRVINISFDYIKRLLDFEHCGSVEFCTEDEKYHEYTTVFDSDSENEIDNTNLEVCLYFDKKEILKNIRYNYYIYST